MLKAPSLLSFFLRPKVTRTLNSDLSIEIENLQESPGLCYIRFYNGKGQVVMPHNLLCIELATSTLVKSLRDRANQPAFLVADMTWHAFCSSDEVFAYVHASGSIFLPTEVVTNVSFSLLLISYQHAQIPFPEVQDMSLMMTPSSSAMWGYIPGM